MSETQSCLIVGAGMAGLTAAGALQATPLMDTMAAGVGRWLKANPRDFFYVTALGQ